MSARAADGLGKRRWLLAALLCAWAYAYLPWLGALDLQMEEPRRVLVTRAMLESGEYWVPQLAGETYTAKPPLFNWAIAASAGAFGGVTEFTARLPSVLAVLALAVAFVAGARRWLGASGVAFIGAALVLAPEILAKGRLAEIEPVFTLLVALSIGGWFWLYDKGKSGARLWVLPLALTALAYLTKREPAVVFFYLAVGPYLVLRGHWRALLQPGHFAGIAVAALLVSGWLIGTAAATSWGELWDTLRREVLERGVSGESWSDFAAHIAFYPSGLFVSMLPFSSLLLLYASRTIRASVRQRHGELWVFCALAVAANLPLYWLRGDVAIRYFLPMYPFVLLLAAMVFEVLVDGRATLGTFGRRYLAAVRWGTFAVAALALLVLAVSPFLSRWVDGFVPLFPAVVTLALVAAGAFALVWLARRARRAEVGALLMLFCAAVLSVRSVYFNVVLADRVTRYEIDRNAPAIAARVAELAGSRPIRASGVPWAVWYYGDALVLDPLAAGSRPAAGEWVLIDAAQPLGVALDERARFEYKDQVLVLGVAR